MHLSCDCLNILISSKIVNFTDFEPNISESFTSDSFFNEDIGLLSLCSINIQVPSLVKERETGPWRIVTCLNCNKSCYGLCKTMGFGSILARKDLQVDTNKINRLKQSDLYSPIFKILIYQNDFSSDDEPVGDQKTSLYPAATSWLKEQALLTEERVKSFSDKEYAALDELRKRAYKEQRVINRREQECAKVFTKNDPVIKDLSVQLSKSSTIENKRKRLVSRSSVEDSSFDSEGVFLLDGFEGGDGGGSHPEDSDSDEPEDLAPYHPRRMSAAQLAKSLPIPVPQFLEDKHQNDPLLGSPQVPTDIAASIKALAKSVHGDAVFGELPPPRFSTHL